VGHCEAFSDNQSESLSSKTTACAGGVPNCGPNVIFAENGWLPANFEKARDRRDPASARCLAARKKCGLNAAGGKRTIEAAKKR
jgi:hypothetical protein